MPSSDRFCFPIIILHLHLSIRNIFRISYKSQTLSFRQLFRLRISYGNVFQQHSTLISLSRISLSLLSHHRLDDLHQSFLSLLSRIFRQYQRVITETTMGRGGYN